MSDMQCSLNVDWIHDENIFIYLLCSQSLIKQFENNDMKEMCLRQMQLEFSYRQQRIKMYY
jgi:hypothetical protein